MTAAGQALLAACFAAVAVLGLTQMDELSLLALFALVLMLVGSICLGFAAFVLRGYFSRRRFLRAQFPSADIFTWLRCSEMRSGISRIWVQYPGPEDVSPKIRSSGSLVLAENGLSLWQGSEQSMERVMSLSWASVITCRTEWIAIVGQSVEVVNIDVLVDDQKIPLALNIIERNGSVMTNRPKRVAKEIRGRYGARFWMPHV
ncbi:hypothetical protein [Lysinibacter cavernae]|uniref:Uncharacterized protein n=1 Tax=Lysinibacter cavernae TaxID=1640652 RepID=A0A7X5R3C6_9MICO|nr:hypothetical protein [Lysinibacter cavernae]NIH54915.1 hypothetical protein [Lysinibacter cavernae]